MLSLRRDGLSGILSMYINTGGCKEDRTSPFSLVSREGWKAVGTNWNKGNSIKQKKKILSYEGKQTLN